VNDTRIVNTDCVILTAQLYGLNGSEFIDDQALSTSTCTARVHFLYTDRHGALLKHDLETIVQITVDRLL